MCRYDEALDLETMLTDPLIRLVMQSDGVTVSEMWALLARTQDALAARNGPRTVDGLCRGDA